MVNGERFGERFALPCKSFLQWCVSSSQRRPLPLSSLPLPCSPFLAQTAADTSAFKWVRAVPPGLFTGLHIDRVYMGGGSARLLTAWIPIGKRAR